MQELREQQIAAFQAVVWKYYRQHGRHDLPWRLADDDGRFDPYKILVSEIMLQQTQVPRVIPKFQEFIHHFPTVQALARAPLSEVLRLWSGLGYNRRAKFLWQAAQRIVGDFKGHLPNDRAALQTLPGVGPNTAGAVMTYAYNQPVVFIETNIRTVFIHHFFTDRQSIPDKALVRLIEQTLDKEQTRQWYWALMDYGSFLKKSVGNLNRASQSYTKQSPFQGSRRQIRGQVIRALLLRPYGYRQLATVIGDPRLSVVLSELRAEGLVELKQNSYHLLAR